MKTIDEIIAENPWMEHFRDDIRETCHDCAVGLGESHVEGCDTARCLSCGGQRMICPCGEEGRGDIWLGLMYPKFYKICLEKDFWCHDILIEDDGTKTIVQTAEDFKRMLDVGLDEPWRCKWHVPCKRTDPGAHVNLNRAAENE
mgnify:CR=1 FL=1